VLRTAEPLALDPYADNRQTGSFLLIDPADGTTLAAGMADEPFETVRHSAEATTEEDWV
jgi:sulfate adenylyltransferase subunit 1